MKSRIMLMTVIGIILLISGMILSVCIGAKNIAVEEILNALLHYDDSINAQLIRNIRLPRMICGILVGGMLALTGTMMQGILRNPVAEPSILGITQGATLMIAITAVTNYVSVYGNAFMAFIGAGISGGLMLLFTLRNASNQSMARILLAGTALSTFFLAMASIVALLGNRSQELAFWVAGGLRQANWKQVVWLLIIGGIFSALSFLIAPEINIVSLGDDVATGLGLIPEKVKFKVILFLIPMCAVCVAAAGNIAYVGLFIPHIIRRIIGNDYRFLMPLSFLYGGIVLVIADIAARMIATPYELPVGLFTSCIGVPVFLWLIRKEKQ